MVQEMQFIRIVTQFTMPNASNPVVMRWDYQVTGTSQPFALTQEGPNIRDAFIARYLVPLEPYIANDVILTQFDIRAWETPSDGYTDSGLLWQGDNVNPRLPPFVALSFRLNRNNFSMRNGRKAFPGPTNNMVVAGGVLSTSTADALAVITAVWSEEPMLVEGVTTDITLSERVVREPTTPDTDPTIWTTVNWGRAYFGSQNSRKN